MQMESLLFISRQRQFLVALSLEFADELKTTRY